MEKTEQTQYMTIKQELLHDATQTEIRRDGDQLMIGTQRWHIIGRDPNGDYIAERTDEGA